MKTHLVDVGKGARIPEEIINQYLGVLSKTST